MEIEAEPGYAGAVMITCPPGMSERSRARLLLVTMAYGLFDPVARESVRGVDWSRKIGVRGRPKKVGAKTNAQRQRLWRQRKLADQPLS